MMATLDASGVGHYKRLCVDNLAVGKGEAVVVVEESLRSQRKGAPPFAAAPEGAGCSVRKKR